MRFSCIVVVPDNAVLLTVVIDCVETSVASVAVSLIGDCFVVTVMPVIVEVDDEVVETIDVSVFPLDSICDAVTRYRVELDSSVPSTPIFVSVTWAKNQPNLAAQACPPRFDEDWN